MSTEWEPPRCRHGKIILACPDDCCPEQNVYLAEQEMGMLAYEAAQRRAVRVALGLSDEG